MILELLFNVALLLLFIFMYWYIGATMPESASTELGAEQWPRLIIVGLIILMVINIYKIYKETPAEKRNANEFKNISLKSIVMNKLFGGIIIVLLYAAILERFGFILSTLIGFSLYSALLGERRIKTLAITSILITFGSYFVFARGLGIMLPRGYGILRDLALLLETL